MLVLARKANERIFIDEHIELTVLRIDGHRVTLGISAPRDVIIRRGAPAADLGSNPHGQQPSPHVGLYRTALESVGSEPTGVAG